MVMVTVTIANTITITITITITMTHYSLLITHYLLLAGTCIKVLHALERLDANLERYLDVTIPAVMAIAGLGLRVEG